MLRRTFELDPRTSAAIHAISAEYAGYQGVPVARIVRQALKCRSFRPRSPRSPGWALDLRREGMRAWVLREHADKADALRLATARFWVSAYRPTAIASADSIAELIAAVLAVDAAVTGATFRFAL